MRIGVGAVVPGCPMKQFIKNTGILAFCCALHCNVVANVEVECLIMGSEAVLQVVGASHLKQIKLEQSPEVCERGFEFTAATSNSTAGLLRIAPSHLGLNAQNEVFRISFETGSATRLGEVPASADLVDDETFIQSVQQAFSIHRTVYFIQGDSIAISPDSLELVTGGTVCTDVANRVYVREIASNTDCKKSIKASFSLPVCLIHHGLAAAVSSLDRCASISASK